MMRPADRRQAVQHAQEAFGLSERSACSALGFPRASHRYQSLRVDAPELVAKLQKLAIERPRFGYRRLYELERVVDTVEPGGIPAALSVLLFEDDDSVAFRRYVDELEDWLEERGAADTVLVEIPQLCQLPSHRRGARAAPLRHRWPSGASR